MKAELEIVKLYNEGVKLKKIAEQNGESYHIVTKLIYQKYGLCERRKSFDRNEVGRVRDLYLTDLLTQEQIAERLGIPRHRVSSIVRAYRIIKRKKNDTN